MTDEATAFSVRTDRPGRFVTSRGYVLPATPEEMEASPWFNLWQRRLWPYRELSQGDTLYWYDATEQAVVWASRVTWVTRFEYGSKDEVRERLRAEFDDPSLAHPYLDRAADQGYCLAYRVDQVRRVRVPKPDGYRFPQEGWLRLDEVNAPEEWAAYLRTDTDGRWALDLRKAAGVLTEEGYFSPPNLRVECEWRVREVVQRRGQPEFRDGLIRVYGGRCAVTRCDAIAALEAAHVAPYSETFSNHITNGILLRADIHTLFDLDLIGIDPQTMTVTLARAIRGTSYGNLEGRLLTLPADPAERPDSQALLGRWLKFKCV